MVKFREHFRDLDAWSKTGLPFSKTTNEAVKLYDAALDQMLYYYDSPHYGGFTETVCRMREADPTFVSGNLLYHSLGLFVSNSHPHKIEFNNYLVTLDMTKLDRYELLHIEAIKRLEQEDMIGAMRQYAHISRLYPYDMHSTNLGFVLSIMTSHPSYSRDIPLSIIEKYNPETPFYSLLEGKLCFGYAETSRYDLAEKYGRCALERFPLDSWAAHAMGHMFENQSKAREEVEFLESTKTHWIQGVNFTHHLYWHTANAYIQLGDHETALTLYDVGIKPTVYKTKEAFPLSDATSCLTRLYIDGYDTRDELRNLNSYWKEHNNEMLSFFYDGHAAFSAALSGDSGAIDEIMENMKEFINSNRSGWNKFVSVSFGLQFCEGMTALSQKQYNIAASKLISCLPQATYVVQGSKAQKSIFSLLVVFCCLKSGQLEHLQYAQRHMQELLELNHVTILPPLQQRLWNKMNDTHNNNSHMGLQQE